MDNEQVAPQPQATRFSRVTVVVPTYKEVENLPHLITRLGKVREEHGLDLDVLDGPLGPPSQVPVF